MRNVLTACLIGFALLVAPTTAVQADGAATDRIRVNPALIAELVFGVYCAEDPVRTEEAPETASGVINIVPELPLIRSSRTIVPAALDVGFGVLSRASDGMVLEPVVVTVTHPPFPDSGIEVERWTTRFESDDFNLTGFSFDVPEEMVLGTWTFAAHLGEEELFFVSFEVVPPELAANVLAECQMGFTS